MPSADFSPPFSFHRWSDSCPMATVGEISRGKASFIPPVLADLLHGLRMTLGLSQSKARLPSLYSLISTFCTSVPRVCLGLPSDFGSPRTPLSIANTSGHNGVQEICTPLNETMPDTPNRAPLRGLHLHVVGI